MTLKTLTIALVCGTAQAGYSIQQAHEFLRLVPAYDSRLPPAVLPAVFLVPPVRKSIRGSTVSAPHAIDAISTQVHARPSDGVARGGGLYALVQVLL